MDFLALLSDTATPYLEAMAQQACILTRKHFGNVIFMFTPMYISNYCENRCRYCSFAAQHTIERRQLGFEEIEEEAKKIAATGMRHILVLTGEARHKATIEYVLEALTIISRYFSSVGIEIYPLEEEEYGQCIARGVDSLTIYQELYDEQIYHQLHQGGPKDNYQFRLDAPERACRKAIHTVTVGSLLGLHDYRIESFFTLLHARYLQSRYPGTDIAISLPRLRPLVTDFYRSCALTDRQFVQLLCALRLCMPTAGITISTRESASFRNSLLPLGVTKMSAGVSTAVGGNSENPSTTQFEIADTRSLEQMKADLLSLGYQPVLHDWNSALLSIKKQ
jgi:2-iminoacetate synthase